MAPTVRREPHRWHPARRALLILLGTMALSVGMIGLFVPGLPTTPFLLIASGCYVRSSERLYRWLTSRTWYAESVGVFIEKRALPMKTKVITLALVWGTLGYLALFTVENLALKSLILALALTKTLFISLVKTAR
jgi:uncharacterized membrane protein YbaN (DUF454 family)